MPSVYLPAAIEVALTVAICLSLAFGPKTIVARSRVNRSLQSVIIHTVRGPIVVAVAAFGVSVALASALNAYSGAIPSILQPSNVVFVLELIILASSVRTAGVITKQVLPSITKAREADKVLIYSIYTLGLFFLAYIVLSSPISPEIATNTWAVINFLTGVFVTYLAVYIVNVVFRRYSSAIENKEAGLRTTITFVRRLALSIVALIGVAAATFTSFPAVGGVVASLFIAAGFASIVIGLAAQTSLSNLVAGMVISTSQPFRVGDALSYANEWAWVEDIKLTFTILRTWDNRRLIVPNQMFLNTTMVNYDYGDSSKLCVVYVTITYESDLDRAIEILKEAGKRHPDFLPIGNLPVVHVMDFTDSGINLRLLGRAKDQPTNFQMSKDILYEVKKEFDACGIELAYPRRQIVIDPKPRRTAASRLDQQDLESARGEFEKSLLLKGEEGRES